VVLPAEEPVADPVAADGTFDVRAGHKLSFGCSCTRPPAPLLPILEAHRALEPPHLDRGHAAGMQVRVDARLVADPA
jgi:hypothetical protein